ncbi:hypothetical protein HPB48_010659 [Haemaphysalis longicornis]|uniref:Uncharacterized protein n=1 Tax=Haemaphysalis longicornis TaxID=44386 RepID=A0A9J6FYG6_HAELO|nr:hypothetical protein HPB48_010659 [Haemaphysalis longicornis]
MSLGEIWESAGAENHVPSYLNCINFAFTDDDVVVTEDVSIDELASGVPENEKNCGWWLIGPQS